MNVKLLLAFYLVWTSFSLQIQTAEQTQQNNLSAIPKNNYPVRIGFVQKLTQYYPLQRLAASLGVPGYTDQKIYNYILLGSWKCSDTPSNAASVWSKPIDYFGTDSVFGKTKDQIQKNLKQKYNDAKTQLLVTAFGNSEMPATLGLSALECASSLATFVLDNNLDGCNVNFQDEDSLRFGAGYQWLITFQTHLRNLLPNQTITHSPQPSYFRSEDYKNQSYTQIHAKLNKTINFYNIQFFNQGTSKYNTYEQLFIRSTGAFPKTSVSEIVERGVDLKKIVVVKPVSPSDTIGSGWMDLNLLGTGAAQAYTDLKWFGGIGIWQYSSDVRGKAMNSGVTKLKQLCTTNKDCK